ncbi:LysR family transcriptional regulator [Cupriavidus numazuensis]|uniref:Hydrogen peroxide-inducible genes activator n=1 Tax=Cupriavidus numazuensis TaxID=221992 RepID=A0ABM8TTX1_9BURK|nr:LysR family transcriptional regulator [Cupriavidus numazuensis]CAG2159945.1 Hydrogen peroxide-inducible genes activator [Cupriavidus numazuensis]
MSRINFGLEDLQAFVATAEKGSFRMAAEALHISQPALSRRIEKLEMTLGSRLLERTTRRVDMTHIGRQFLEEARAALDILDSAVLRLGDEVALQRGLVTVAAIPSAALHFLPHAIRRFGSQHPGVRVRVIDESANAVLASVLSGESDFGLNFVGAQEPNIEFRAIRAEPYRLALRRDHPWAGRDCIAWEELAGQRMVSVSKQSGNRALIENAIAHLKRRPTIHYEANHVVGVLALVEAGLGMAVLPGMVLPQDHPRLCGILLVEPSVDRVLALIRRRDRPLQPAAEALYETLTSDTAAAT